MVFKGNIGGSTGGIVNNYKIEIEIYEGKGGQLRKETKSSTQTWSKKGSAHGCIEEMGDRVIRSGKGLPTQKILANCVPGYWTACTVPFMR
jgi:hypothetical protein